MMVFEKPLETNEQAEIAKSLAYSIQSCIQHDATMRYKGEKEDIDMRTIERLIVAEFWHALNRRRLVVNDDVDKGITATLNHLKELRTPAGIHYTP